MAENAEGIEISPFEDAGFDDCFDAKYVVNQTLLIRQFRFRFHNLDRKQYLARKFEFIKRVDTEGRITTVIFMFHSHIDAAPQLL